MVAALLAAGADPKAYDKNGETPLHVAARWSSLDAIEALIAAGADANARDESGKTPLHTAVGSAVVAALLAAGADANARDEGGKTPLHTSAGHEYPYTIEALLAAGADANARDEGGKTPLHTSAGHEYPYTIEALLAAGADANARDEGGKTPLHTAEERNRPDNVTALRAAAARQTGHDRSSKVSLGCTQEDKPGKDQIMSKENFTIRIEHALQALDWADQILWDVDPTNASSRTDDYEKMPPWEAAQTLVNQAMCLLIDSLEGVETVTYSPEEGGHVSKRVQPYSYLAARHAAIAVTCNDHADGLEDIFSDYVPPDGKE